MMIITDNLISTYVFQMHYSLSGGNIFSTIETDQMRRAFAPSTGVTILCQRTELCLMNMSAPRSRAKRNIRLSWQQVSIRICRRLKA